MELEKDIRELKNQRLKLIEEIRSIINTHIKLLEVAEESVKLREAEEEKVQRISTTRSKTSE